MRIVRVRVEPLNLNTPDEALRSRAALAGGKGYVILTPDIEYNVRLSPENAERGLAPELIVANMEGNWLSPSVGSNDFYVRVTADMQDEHGLHTPEAAAQFALERAQAAVAKLLSA